MTIELFQCPNIPGNLSLTKNSCAAQWQKALTTKPEKGGSLYECRGCELGAKHAGVENVTFRKPSSIDRICTRCHKPTSKFLYKRICISCYNRGLEVLKGKNARGTRPVKHGDLVAIRLAYIVKGVTMVVLIENVTSRLEAEMAVIKSSSESVVFVHSVDVVKSQQVSLFGGI